MSRRFTRASVACSLAVGAAILGPAGIAQASDATLRATVRSNAPKILRSQARILNGIAAYEKSHSATALIKAIRAQDAELKAFRTKLAGESPSTAAGTKGKADIIAGLTLIVSSNNTIGRSLQKGAKGAPSKSQVTRAIAAARKGNLDLNAGAKLLHV